MRPTKTQREQSTVGVRSAIKVYKGIHYRVTKLDGLTIIEGYDRGVRVIFACSKKEFHKKVAAYLATGATNQSVPWRRKQQYA